ncbi:MAG: carboxymuconolactone decarboxylase family protein [Rubrivivax sp.]|nr:carboxymuconolactone decarboxylase family protein [Rubrivivax sp.]
MSADRLPPIPQALWSAEQRASAQEIIDGPRGALLAPFIPLLRSPELLTHAQRMGEYLRYRSAIGLKLSELAILITARQWSQQVEWAIHAPIALRAGIAERTLADIAQGRRPPDLPDDEAAVHDFCIELQRNHAVCDATWNEVVTRFGEAGAVDLIGINGYYALLSMVMNAARTPAPDSAARPLPRLAG